MGGDKGLNPKNPKNMREAGAQGDIDFKTAPWPSISEAAKDCVRKLLTMDPAHRPTAQQILEARCPALRA